MFRKIVLQLLIISVLLSGCAFINDDELPEVTEFINTENVVIAPEPEQVPATSIEEVKAGEPNSFKENLVPVEKVSLIIDFGSNTKEVKISYSDDMTVYDVLQSGTEQLGIELETQKYSVGIFIVSIGDKKNGQDNNYWTYDVNNKFANVASDKYKLKAGDRVEWKFGKSKF